MPTDRSRCSYVSQSSKAVRAEFRAGKSAHLTMGEAETALAPPEEFLRKNARQATFHKRAKSARAHRESQKFSFGGSLKIHRDQKLTHLKNITICKKPLI